MTVSERRGASQIEVLSIGNTNIAMCAKRFPFSFPFNGIPRSPSPNSLKFNVVNSVQCNAN